ncbi:MAG: hypothetical protein P8R42_15555 [Candidatus Binatia bacterium]|nr:hypothetical protein [Candidatus Binatia bacterium]
MADEKVYNGPGDVVLVHLDGKPAGYARVEAIRGHARPGWHECDLLFLAQPLQPVTWILEREQIDGTSFSMGGRPVQIERLPDPGEVHLQRPDASDEPEPQEKPKAPAPKKRAGKRGDNVVQLVRKPAPE